MHKTKTIKILNILLIVFLLIQPLCDIYMSVVGERLDIFGISIATLIRTVSTTVAFILVATLQIKYKHKIKYLYYIGVYLLLVIIYTIVHHLNIVYSDGYYITQGIYSALTELLYVERLIVPVLIMYIVMLIKPKREKIEKAIVVVAYTISLVIIITNIFKVSFASYDESKIISYNLIDWFTKEDLSYKQTLSKGWFVSANQIGSLLLILLPIVVYYVIRKDKLYLYLGVLLQVISMILIGTRVASYGWLIAFGVITIVYILLWILKKIKLPTDKALISLVIIFEIGVLLLILSPAKNREFASTYEGMYEDEILEDGTVIKYMSLEEYYNILSQESLLKEYIGVKEYENVSVEELKKQATLKYISENHRYHYITNKYIKEIYPYTDDPEFWINIFEMPKSIKGDNRSRQVEIIKRIKQNNNNTLFDTLVGMGATPLNARGYMIENDLISHYYNLGLIGIILFMTPFILGIISYFLRNIKNLKRIFNMPYILCSLVICTAYLIGFFAGHVLDEYVITIFVAVIAATIFNMGRLKEERG